MRRNRIHNLKLKFEDNWLPKLIKDVLHAIKNVVSLITTNKIAYLPVLYSCCILVTNPVLAKQNIKAQNRQIENEIPDKSVSDKYESHINKIKKSYNIDVNEYDTVKNIEHGLPLIDIVNMPAEEDEYESDELTEEMLLKNKSVKGFYVGSSCEDLCNAKLHHVNCDPVTKTCNCDRNHPVILGLLKGCAKPKQLGEQCYYHQTCQYNDENSLCVQVSHNARCQCAPGFHSVSYSKPTKRVFCTEDLATITSDLPTLLGVTTGIAVLAGLICMVLHLFSKTKYPRHRNLADANLPPPIMYSSDTGVYMAAQSGRPSSRSSLHSNDSIGSYGNQRPSSAPQIGSKGVLVSTSRTGSRRPSLASVRSTSSSVRSYGIMRFEKEIQQKEIRQEMKLRLAKFKQQQYISQNQHNILVARTVSYGAIAKMVPTHSPLTPNSMDELLPSVDESREMVMPRLERNLSNKVAFNGPYNTSSDAI